MKTAFPNCSVQWKAFTDNQKRQTENPIRDFCRRFQKIKLKHPGLMTAKVVGPQIKGKEYPGEFLYDIF